MVRVGKYVKEGGKRGGGVQPEKGLKKLEKPSTERTGVVVLSLNSGKKGKISEKETLEERL